MIDHEIVELKAENAYQAILNPKLLEIFPSADHSLLIKDLKERVGNSCAAVVIEYPYRDFDFSSVYAQFYAKKHVLPSRECIRLQLFADRELKDYLGFCIVRDSPIDSRGRAVLSPELLLTTNKAYVLTCSYRAHLVGSELHCDTWPWMAQDTDIAVCAHVAVWSIVNYYASKYARYQQRSIGEIADMAPTYLGRKTPSEGLNLIQISELFTANGFYPLILNKQAIGEQAFLRAVFSYIESGIPMVGALTKQGHAIAVVGHGEIDRSKLLQAKGLSWHSDFIPELIISDDNHLPFTVISDRPTAAYPSGDWTM